MLSMLYCGNPFLNKTVDPVTVFDSSVEKLIEELFEVMDANNGVGLAAPQVGINKRIFVVDTRQNGERLAFINPEIIATSDDSVPYEEGCLSVPGVFRTIYRPSTVEISYKKHNGKSEIIRASGLLARVIQHENDHLNGRLFISRLSDEEMQDSVREFRKKNKHLLKKINAHG
ncbi:MAG: peptide deformylase [Sphaerochaetaceae bacterium]|nr:peptide deformylase [Spirochaetales bacterium]MDY5967922.1 peptide deformylase [Sphaerochaetaceae bacterium]